MSLETVLKNVYTFAHILGQASGKTASHWDVQALNNALKWAAYCQEIQAQVQNERTKKALNRKLLEMGIMLEPPGSVCLSVDLLGQATDILLSTLLHNTYTSKVVLSELKSRNRKREETLLQKFSDLISTHGVVDIPEDVMDFLEEKDIQSSLVQSSYIKKSPEKMPEETPVVLAQAQMLLQTLVSYSDRTQSEVHHILERVSCLKHGWETLVCVLYAEGRSTVDDTSVRNSVVQWMSSRRDTYMKLWHVPNFMTLQAVTKNTAFYHLYINALGELTNQMTAEYHKLTNGRLYSWRCKTSDGDVSFDDLVTKYQSLLNNDTVRMTTVCHLAEKAKATYFNIWRDICRQLH